MATHYKPHIVTDGLVLYLDAANPKSYLSGNTTWNDLSRKGNNGTLINGPTFSSENGGSIVFDRIKQNCSQISSFTSTSQNMTFSLWFNPNKLPTSTVHQIVYIVAENAFTIRFYKNSNFAEQKLAWLVYYQRTNLTVGAVLPDYTYPMDLWANTVVTFNDTGKYELYVNGIIQNTTQTINFVRWLLPNGAFYINYQSTGFNGRISQMQVYNRTLTPQEILQNYNATKGRFNL